MVNNFVELDSDCDLIMSCFDERAKVPSLRVHKYGRCQDSKQLPLSNNSPVYQMTDG